MRDVHYEMGCSGINIAVYWGQIAVCQALGLSDMEVRTTTQDISITTPAPGKIRVGIHGPRRNVDQGAPFEADIFLQKTASSDYIIDAIWVFADQRHQKLDIELETLPNWSQPGARLEAA